VSAKRKGWQVLDARKLAGVNARLWALMTPAQRQQAHAKADPVLPGRRPEDYCSSCGRHVSMDPTWTLQPWPDDESLCSSCHEAREAVEDWCAVEDRVNAKQRAAIKAALDPLPYAADAFTMSDREAARQGTIAEAWRHDDRPLPTAQQQLAAALKVLVLTERVNSYLRAADPMALRQAMQALQAVEPYEPKWQADVPKPGDRPGLSWYVVTGRKHGDDEDGLFVVQAESEAAAVEDVTAQLRDGDDAPPEDVEDERTVYINHVVACGPDKPTIERYHY
jgi:hypothetical protein